MYIVKKKGKLAFTIGFKRLLLKRPKVNKYIATSYKYLSVIITQILGCYVE